MFNTDHSKLRFVYNFLKNLENLSVNKKLYVQRTDVFRTLSNIYDAAFFEKLVNGF